MNRLLSYLEMWRKKPIEEIIDIPKPQKTCYVCDEPNLRTYVVDDVPVCSGCNSDLNRCNYCSQKHIALKNGICNDCVSSSASIRGYSYKPETLFHRVRRSGEALITTRSYSNYSQQKQKPYYLHFGNEIEVDSRTDSDSSPTIGGTRIASIVNCLASGSSGNEKLLYCKEDGTCSLEVVGHPMSWRYFKAYGEEIYETLFKVLKEANYGGHHARDCGHHIHVSRSAISPLTLWKVISFIYNEFNYSFIKTISQRTRESLDEWASLSMTKNQWSYMARLCKQTMDADAVMTRSTAVNLQNNNTIEFRLFNGTLNFQSFCKNMEFVRSVIKWADCTSYNVTRSKSGVESYLNFLDKYHNDYENLVMFLQRVGHKIDKNQVIFKRWSRKHSARINTLKFNSDKGSLPCV